MINRLEAVRKQIEDLLRAQTGRKADAPALRDLDRKLMDVELMLITRTEMHSDDKWYVEAYRVYMNLVWLNGVIGSGAGDVAGGADSGRPDASLEILAMLEKELAAAQRGVQHVMEKDVPAFNRAHAGAGNSDQVGVTSFRGSWRASSGEGSCRSWQRRPSPSTPLRRGTARTSSSCPCRPRTSARRTARIPLRRPWPLRTGTPSKPLPAGRRPRPAP